MGDRVPVIRRRRGVALPAGAVYVGRPSRWGNPFPIVDERGETREVVIDRYRRYIAAYPHLVGELAALKPSALACWCAPEVCHADVLAELLAGAGVSGAETQPDA